MVSLLSSSSQATYMEPSIQNSSRQHVQVVGYHHCSNFPSSTSSSLVAPASPSSSFSPSHRLRKLPQLHQTSTGWQPTCCSIRAFQKRTEAVLSNDASRSCRHRDELDPVNLGAYIFSKEGEVAWFRDFSPTPKRPLSHAIWDLVYNLWTTWAKSSNDYDKVQWNLFFLLKASLTVYTILLMTAYITSRARKLILFTYYMYGWMSRDGKLTRTQFILTGDKKISKIFGGKRPPFSTKN